MSENIRELYLQLFADAPDDMDGKDEFEDESYEEDLDEDTAEKAKAEISPEVQEFLNQKINERIARERAQWERKLEKTFGTKDLQMAGEYYRAGQVVSQRAGLRPREVIQRLSDQATSPGTPIAGDPIREELNEIKNLVMSQHEREILEREESEARKEFGKLYDEYSDEIRDLAEERGLSLTDAAAIVLRPKLKEFYETQSRARSESRRRKKIEGTGDKPDKGFDPEAKLTSEQKRVAKKMGISYKEYYDQLKMLGRIEE